MTSLDDRPICTACGTQYFTPTSEPPSRCRICDDPRQFVPATGQSWTTLATLKQSGHSNKITPLSSPPSNRPANPSTEDIEESIYSIRTDPKFAIGQRALLLTTPHGNVLWDLIAFLDTETIDFIKSKGRLHAIVISHPHYYTTYATWMDAFPGARIIIAADDAAWLNNPPIADAKEGEAWGMLDFLYGPVGVSEEVIPGVHAIKAGGHFPGSLLLLWERRLFIADTIVTVPSAYTPHPRPEGQTSYVFQWSIPNSIPLPPRDLEGMWKVLKGWEWEATHGAFVGMDVRGYGESSEERCREMKKRMLDSLKIQIRGEGWKEEQVALLGQSLA